MNDENTAILETSVLEEGISRPVLRHQSPSIPAYLQDTYWWAYLHPRSIWLFEREWVVNLILWGNMRRLTDAVLMEIEPRAGQPTLQVACVYGDFTRRLASHIRQGDSPLHLVDVAPIQLRNARRKLRRSNNVRYGHQDSASLQFATGSFKQTVVFFLLHEQPVEVRRATISEALRVTRPGGKVIFVDYHRPRPGNPLRYLMRPVLKTLEPFALDLWRQELSELVRDEAGPGLLRSQLFCGGLYQKVVVTRRD